MLGRNVDPFRNQTKFLFRRIQISSTYEDIIFKILIFSQMTISHQGMPLVLEQLASAGFCEKEEERKGH